MHNQTYEYVVVGSGPGGLTVAIGLGVMGKQVCLIEKGDIGGDCTNYGCVPSKALLHVARRDEITGSRAALRYVRAKRQEIRDEETPQMLAAHGVETIFGTARFVDSRTVAIEQPDGSVSKIRAKQIIIATGAKARTIDLPGVDPTKVVTNETVFEIDEDISDLVIVGGGVIACEMGEAFANLGVRVTIIEKHARILSREDPELSDLMMDHLTARGVRILTEAKLIDAGQSSVTVNDPAGSQQLPYDRILLAIGRVPLIDELELDKADVDHDRHGIVVDAYNQTSSRAIWAIGDCVKDNPKFTHWSNNQGRILVQNLLSPVIWWKGSKGHPLPWTIYTKLEFARVGLNEREAVEKYGADALVIRTRSFAENDRSKLTDSTRGYLKLIAKRGSLKIVGVTIVAPAAGEMLPQFTIAIKHGITLWGLSKVIYAYPTKSESIKWLIDDYLHEVLQDRKRELWRLVRHPLALFG